jgi:catechol 2,3-dioxygenase-like lactoylglutathione lyase family enzyme
MSKPAFSGINHVIVFAAPDRWQDTVRFYAETLSLRLVHRHDPSGYAIFAFDQPTTLGVERADPGEDGFPESIAGRFAGVSFAVDDVDAKQTELSALGVKFRGPPETQGWGGRLTYFVDPAGNTMTIVQYPR